jgi:hypothetical protein
MPLNPELAKHFNFPMQTPVEPADAQGHVFCNEKLDSKQLDLIKRKRLQSPGGIGLIVGSGAIYSLLPHLDLDAVILVDRNPAVLGVAALTGACIVSSETPKEAVTRLFTDFPENLHDSQSFPLTARYELNPLIRSDFDVEKSLFRQKHWTTEDAFPRAKATTDSTMIGLANRDITTPDFARELRDLLDVTGLPLTYLNLSNVHSWIGGELRKLVSIARLLDPHVTIQYSRYFRNTNSSAGLQISSTTGFRNYCQNVK